MRKFFVGAVALALLPELALGQSSRPSIGTGGQGAQPNAAANIFTASTQNSKVRSYILPVTQRVPSSTDIIGYYPGVSLWLDQANNLWQFNSSSQWVPYPSPGPNPCSLNPAVTVFCGGTRREIGNWTGPILDLSLEINGTVTSQTFYPLPDGSPDLGAMLAFVSQSGGIAFCTQIYDQSNGGLNTGTAQSYSTVTTGTANPMTQGTAGSISEANLRNSPRFVAEFATNKANVGCATDEIYLSYKLGAGTLTASSYSGSVVTISGGVPWYVQVGDTVTGTNAGTNNIITAVTHTANYTGGTITLTTAPTGTLGALTLGTGNQNVFWNFPSTGPVVPWENHSVEVGIRFGNFATNHDVTTLGQPASAAGSSSLAFANFYVTGNGSTSTSPFAPARVIQGNGGQSIGVYAFGPGMYGENDQVIGYAQGGSSGKTIYWLFGGDQGSITIPPSPQAVNLTGGSVGYTQQYTPATDDKLYYDLLIYNTTLTAAQQQQIWASIALGRGWQPQVNKTLVEVGSSTTAGNGTESFAARPWHDALAVSDIQPMLATADPVGGTVEGGVFQYQYQDAPQYVAGLTPLLIYYPGMGNSLQLDNSFTVSNVVQGQAQFTIPGGVTNLGLGPGVSLTSSCLPSGATVASVTNTTTANIDAAHLPTSSGCTTFQLVNDTGAQVWAGMQSFVAQAVATGYAVRIIDSAARGSFTTAQLQEFGTASALVAQLGPSLPGVESVIDLELQPVFGGDNGAMTVSSVVDSTHFITNTLSNYAAVGNRLKWQGMPVSALNDTGNETITGISGSGPYTITVSLSTSGMTTGEVIHAINPAPWTTYPCTTTGVLNQTGVWNVDRQHYCDPGYALQATLNRAQSISSGVLQ